MFTLISSIGDIDFGGTRTTVDLPNNTQQSIRADIIHDRHPRAHATCPLSAAVPNGLVRVKVIRPKAAAAFLYGHPFWKYEFLLFFRNYYVIMLTLFLRGVDVFTDKKQILFARYYRPELAKRKIVFVAMFSEFSTYPRGKLTTSP